jgi:transcriptional regulator with XRE-family HTH domain
MDKNLRYKIRKLRELKGYTQESVAHELDIDTTTYGDIEAGISNLTVERFKKIAEILGYTTQFIEEFDPSSIHSVHNYQQGGNAGYNVIHNVSVEELAKVLTEPYKQQLAEKDKQIAALKEELFQKNEEIQSLRSQIKQQQG